MSVLASLFLARILSSPQPALSPVSLVEPCISAPELMKKLSALTGEKLQVVDNASRDNFAVRFDAAPINEVMSRLADIEAGEWVMSGSIHLLRRSSARLTKERKQSFELQKRNLMEAQSKCHKALQQSPSFEEEEAKTLLQDYGKISKDTGLSGVERYHQQISLSGRTPMGRAVSKIFTKLTAEEMLALPTGTETVFSTEPYALEKQMPDVVGPVLKALIPEQATWQEETKAAQYAAPSLATAGRVLLTIQPEGDLYGVSIKLEVADRTGKILDQQTALFGGTAGTGAAPVPLVKRLHLSQEEMRLTPNEKEAASVFEHTMPEKLLDRSQFSAGLKFALRHPDVVPVGSLFAGPFLTQVAIGRKENLLAILDNDLVLSLANALSDNPTVEGYYGRVQTDTDVETTENRSWLLVRPTSFDREEIRRPNYMALRKLIQKLDDPSSEASLDDFVNFALDSKKEAVEENSICASYLGGVIAGGFSLMENNDFDALQFYGSLSTAQKEAAAKGLPLSSLSRDQLSMLLRVSLNQRIQRTAFKSSDAANATARSETYDPSNLNWNLKEALQAGLQPQGTLRMSSTTSAAFTSTISSNCNFVGETCMNFEETASQLFAMSAAQSPDVFRLTSFCPSRQAKVDFEVWPSANVSLRFTLKEYKPAGKMVARYEDLPGNVGAALLSRVQELQKKNPGMRFGAPPGTSTTPVP